jgi:hypothetical protein
MPIHLFTIEETLNDEQGVRLLPGPKLSDNRPEFKAMIQGCKLKLIFPDGVEHNTVLVTYGIALQDDGDYFVMSPDPTITLTIPNITDTETIPIGTQVWIGYEDIH